MNTELDSAESGNMRSCNPNMHKQRPVYTLPALARQTAELKSQNITDLSACGSQHYD